MNKDTKFKIKLISFCLILVTVTVLIAYPNCFKGVSDFVKGIRTSDLNNHVVYKVSKLGKLQENITSNKEKLQEACKNNDTDMCKKSLESILKKIDSSKNDVEEELKEANKVACKTKSKNAKSNLKKVKKHYNKLLNEKSKITEAIKINNIESYSKLLSNTSIFGKEINNYSSLGDELPRSNNSEDVEIKDEKSSTAPLASNEYPLDSKNITKNYKDKSLDETAETKFSSEVKEKAKEIGNNPIKLYEYVRNNINFEQYAGSRKGATGTLEQLSGNDYDQSSLLIALLRCNNIPARYVTGTVNVSAEEAIAWTGATDAKQAAKVLASMGNKTVALTSGGNIVSIQIEHVWVEAYCSISQYRSLEKDNDEKIWIPLDPSFKEYEKVQGDYDNIKKSVESQLENNDLSVLGTETEDKLGKVYDYNEGISDKLNEAKDYISNFINDDNYDGKTLLDVTGGLKVKEEHLDCLPLSIPNNLVSIEDRSNKIADEKKEKITINIHGNTLDNGILDYSSNAVDLYGKQLTLSFEPATESDKAIIAKYGDIFNTPAYLINVKPQIKADGKVVAEGSSIGYGESEYFSIKLGRVGLSSDTITATLTAGGYYALGLDYGTISTNELTKITNKLKEMKANSSNYYTDEVAGGILNGIVKSYFARLDGINSVISKLSNVKDTRNLSFGISGFSPAVKYQFGVPVDVKFGSSYVDIGGDAHTVVSYSGDTNSEKEYMLKTGMIASSEESSIIEDACGLPAVSTATLLQKAKDEGQVIYEIGKDNINNVLPNLNVSNNVKNEIVNAVNSGKSVTIPQNQITYYDWVGSVYIVLDETTGAAGYMISGGYAGGQSAVKNEAVSIPEMIGHFLLGVVEAGLGSLPFIALALLTPFAPAIIAALVNVVIAFLFLDFVFETTSTVIELVSAHNKGYITDRDYYNSIAEIAGMVVGGIAIGKAVKTFEKSSLYAKISDGIFKAKIAEYGLEIQTGNKAYEKFGRNEINNVLKSAKEAKNEGLSEESIRNAMNKSSSSEEFSNYCDTVKNYLKGIKHGEVEVKSAEEVNEWWKTEKGYDNPPYTLGTDTYTFTVKERTKFVRVFDNENSFDKGQWFMKAEDIKGLTPAEIQEKFALPTEPKYGIEFYVNPGETIRTGEVNPLFGKTGKGQQFDCIGKFIGEWGDTWELPQN